MKMILQILKKIIFAFFILYGFNMIMDALDMFVPLNVYTVGLVATLGFPGLFLLVGLISFM